MTLLCIIVIGFLIYFSLHTTYGLILTCPHMWVPIMVALICLTLEISVMIERRKKSKASSDDGEISIQANGTINVTVEKSQGMTDSEQKAQEAANLTTLLKEVEEQKAEALKKQEDEEFERLIEELESQKE